MGLVVSGAIEGVFPAHALTTLYYLARNYASRADAERAMNTLLRHFKIGNLDTSGWQRARQLGMDDFEDAVVSMVAAQTDSTFIITRNIGDFARSPVPGTTPVDFLLHFARTPAEEG